MDRGLNINMTYIVIALVAWAVIAVAIVFGAIRHEQDIERTRKNKMSGSFIMNIPDGPGYSPDGGRFWAKGQIIFWEDGDIWDSRDGGIIRYVTYKSGEDYSSWSDEKRASVREEWRVMREKIRKESEEREEVVNKLRESAKSKLTPEEIEACDL